MLNDWEYGSQAVLFLDDRTKKQLKVRSFACQLTTEDQRDLAITQLNTGEGISQWYESSRTVLAFEVKLTDFSRENMFSVLKEKLMLLDRYEQHRRSNEY